MEINIRAQHADLKQTNVGFLWNSMEYFHLISALLAENERVE